MAVRGFVEPAADAQDGEPARQARPLAGRDVASNRMGTDRGMVGGSVPEGRDTAAALYRGRFTEEARASLPGRSGEATLPAHPNAVFAAISLQRLRLRHDQQVPEWGGVFADDKTGS
jgi:hypothetical protein